MEKLELIDGPLTEPRRRYNRTGIFTVPVNFERDFEELKSPPVLVSSFGGDNDLLNKMVFTKYDDDMFDNVPVCACGYTRGGHMKGEYCHVCGHECMSPTEREVKPTIWLSGLDPVEYFMNPQIYSQLTNQFKVSGSQFKILDYLMDPKYKSPIVGDLYEQAAKLLDLPRGMISFHNQFDKIMDTLINGRVSINVDGVVRTVRFLRLKSRDVVTAYLDTYRDRVFTRFLPFPSKINFILEEFNDTVRGDHEAAPLLNALYGISNAVAKLGTLTLKEKESIVARTTFRIAMYYKAYDKDNLFEKKGIYRKLVYGFRTHWTFRTVITSNHGVNRRNELHLPWGAAMMTYKLHIANLLLKRGRTPNQIFSLIYDNTHRYHRTIDEIFCQLISESPEGKGLPVLHTRYPSLTHGSTQLFRVTRIKTDINDVSTSNSPINLVASNADYDGDYMTGMAIIDNHFLGHMERMEPHTGLMDLSKPFRVSNHGRMPEPILSTINQRLLWCEDNV